MQQLILIVHVLVAVAIVALVLMQHGKGADVGAAFGSGSSNTMFGSAGSMSFLMKLTALLGAVFFATSLGLSYMASRQAKQPNTLTSMQQNVAPRQALPQSVLGGNTHPAKK